jgi:hypothetical protein
MSYGKPQTQRQAVNSQAQELTRQALRHAGAQIFGTVRSGDARPRRESLGYEPAGPINPYVRISGTSAPLPAESNAECGMLNADLEFPDQGGGDE